MTRPPITLPSGVKLRDPEDVDTLRDDIFEGVKTELQATFPRSYGGVRLELADLDYEGPERFSADDQATALMEDKYLFRKLRGTLRLVDENTGDVLDEQRHSLMRVPWMTPRGTFDHQGNEYMVAMQQRLVPGPYTRRANNGALETHFNPRPGSGRMFRLAFDPETAQYHMGVQASNLHLYSLLNELGVDDAALEKQWGRDVLEANRAKFDKRVLPRAYKQLVSRWKQQPDPSPEDMRTAVKDALEQIEVNASVARRTLPNWMNTKAAAEWAAKRVGRVAAEAFFSKTASALAFAPDCSPTELRGWRMHDYIDQRALQKLAATKVDEDAPTYAVDLDGTLAKHYDGEFDMSKIGEPVPKMLAHVKRWIREGKKVVIFTARAADKEKIPPIKKWLRDNGIGGLEVTNEKRPEFSRFYDDRAIAVGKDTGVLKNSAKEDRLTRLYRRRGCCLSCGRQLSLADIEAGLQYCDGCTGEKQAAELKGVETVRIVGANACCDVKARIDTGAAYSSIDKELAKDLDLGKTVDHIEVTSANGTEKRPVKECEIEIGAEEYEVKFTVADRADMEHPVLIGRDVLGDDFVVQTKEAATAEDIRLLSYVPEEALDAVKEHGLLSGDALARPENRALLELARGGDADEWLAEREQLMQDEPWKTRYQGPSVFFGPPHEPSFGDDHPLVNRSSMPVSINLSKLVAAHPGVRLHGVELEPYERVFDEVPDDVWASMSAEEKDPYLARRHRDLTLEEIADLVEQAKNPEEFWRHYDGAGRYAGNVPHLQVILPDKNGIPPEYLDFEKAAAVKTLQQAKTHSDAGQYAQKHALLYQLMLDNPADFMVDSRAGDIWGITHVPSGFKVHVPAQQVPASVARHVYAPVAEKEAAVEDDFTPDLGEVDMQEAYDAIYGKSKPQLASMKAWPARWMPPGSDPLGWVNWYQGYLNGTRTQDDDRQIKRWKSFKARQGAKFKKNPTPRRAFALRYWAIDPLKMLPQEQQEDFQQRMEDYRAAQTEQWMREKTAEMTLPDLRTLANFLNANHRAGIPTDGTISQIEQAIVRFLGADDAEASALLAAADVADQIDMSKPMTAPEAVKVATPEKGCLMLEVPDHDALRIVKWAQDEIAEADLAGDGIERESHITVLYGFDPDVTWKEIKPLLPEGTIDFKLGRIKRFEANEHRPESDVLVVEVESDDLQALNAKLKEEFAGRWTSNYDGYRPHLTLAYVKPGTCTNLDRHGRFAGEHFACCRLKFSGPKMKRFITIKTQ